MIYGDPNNPYTCWIEGKPYSTDEKQKTGDLCIFMQLDTSFLRRDGEEGRLGVTLDHIKKEVAHRTARRIACMYADERKYQITNEPVKHITVRPHGSGLSDFDKGIVVYQTIRSILLDPFSTEIGDYTYPGNVVFYPGPNTKAILNRRTNEIFYFAPAHALGHNIFQRVASMGNGATVQPGDIEIAESMLVVEPGAIELGESKF